MTGPLPTPLHGDDLLALAARAKVMRELGCTLTADEAFQLGEGVEILAADLDRERNFHQVTVLQLEQERDAHAETKRLLEEARAKLEWWRKPRVRPDGARTIAATTGEDPDTLVVDVPVAGGAK